MRLTFSDALPRINQARRCVILFDTVLQVQEPTLRIPILLAQRNKTPLN